jgi:hypothetical protein
MSGSTQQYPNVYAGASGSASRLYSSDSVMLQKAGLQACGTPIATAQPIEVVLPTCYCGVNGPTTSNPTVNDNSNPYLPAFDTFYAAKNRCFPYIDQNQKHTVAPCCTKL